MQTIDISELELLTESENPVIVDVREDFEYNSGHVPNAKNIPLSQLEERYAEISVSQVLVQLGPVSIFRQKELIL